MADNVTANPGSGGATFATDEDTANSRHVPYSKLMFGGDGIFTIVSTSNGLPIDIRASTVDVMLGTDFSSVLGTANIVATTGSSALTIGLHALGSDGTNARLIKTDSAGELQVDVITMPTVTITDGGSTISIDDGSASITVDGTVAVSSISGSVQINDGAGSITVDGTVAVSGVSGSVTVAGDIAHDSADSGNPIKIGGKARSTDPTLVTASDRVDTYHDLAGRVVTTPCPLSAVLSGTNSSTGTANTEIIAAQGAGTRIALTRLIISNESTTSTAVLIKDGTTTKLRIPAPTNSGGVGGAVIPIDPPLLLSDNTALNFASVAGVSTMHVSAVAFAVKG
jgi:hypothetical protein